MHSLCTACQKPTLCRIGADDSNVLLGRVRDIAVEAVVLNNDGGAQFRISGHRGTNTGKLGGIVIGARRRFIRATKKTCDCREEIDRKEPAGPCPPKSLKEQEKNRKQENSYRTETGLEISRRRAKPEKTWYKVKGAKMKGKITKKKKKEKKNSSNAEKTPPRDKKSQNKQAKEKEDIDIAEGIRNHRDVDTIKLWRRNETAIPGISLISGNRPDEYRAANLGRRQVHKKIELKAEV
ncbi:hypothetical protein B0H19DRAFT_1085897 [Mycena capillaripes]|nr:hypothetical protein B0H19DRAFT_1085897 [Mycena capillaripes]